MDWTAHPGPSGRLRQLRSCVRKSESLRIAGAATTTIGTIIAQESSQALNQWLKNESGVTNVALALAETSADVRPDWRMPNTWWTYLRGMLSINQPI
jgi:hypothetical protein